MIWGRFGTGVFDHVEFRHVYSNKRYFMFKRLKHLPGHILGIEGEVVGILGFGVGGLVLLLIPFLDRRTARGEQSHLFTWLAIAMIVFMIVLTYLGYMEGATE